MPGRKTLIWITTSFKLFDLELGIDFRPDMGQVARAMNDAGTALYAVEGRGIQGALSGLTAIQSADRPGPRGPAQLNAQMRSGGEGDPLELATMNLLADRTGGQVFYNKSNEIEESIRSAVDDGQVVYRLGFYPQGFDEDSAADPKGSWHKLKVVVSRPGVNLRYRETYFASNKTSAAEERPSLADLLRDPLNATQLEVTASLSADSVKVNVPLAGLRLEHADGKWNGGLDVSVTVAGSGQARTKTLALHIPDDQIAQYFENRVRMSRCRWRLPRGRCCAWLFRIARAARRAALRFRFRIRTAGLRPAAGLRAGFWKAGKGFPARVWRPAVLFHPFSFFILGKAEG